MVAYKIAVASLVGPSQAAIIFGWPSARVRLIESPATTGSSTSKPSAMISVATDTCWMSTPSKYIMPKVMAKVMGMEIAIRTADRHSQKPISETSTTRMMASYKASMNRLMFSLTCKGWSEVRAIIKSSGRYCLTAASF
jgi:hypothetical protein